MRLSSREAVLVLSTAAVALFGGSALVARPKVDVWKETRRQQEAVRTEIEQDERLLQQRESLETELAELSQSLPAYSTDKKMDIHWLSTMDRFAAKHGVKISRRQAGEEKKAGDVRELPIECQQWEGNLDSLVHFLFDLQSEGGMLDVRHLLIKPEKGDLLRGRFTLYCAYTRESAE